VVWDACRGEEQIQSIKGVLYRQVESQEQVATLGYVDTLAEQAVLEELLDGVKPPPPQGYEHLHYLLYTPFRYPPLAWGSRFGKAHEPSLFYGGCSYEATLAESAFYRLLHLTSMDGKAPKNSMRSEHTVFSVGFASDLGVKLQNPPFDTCRDQLVHPQEYTVTQKLGADMRDNGIQVFEYTSARSLKEATCVALYTPAPFIESRPASMEQWLCETSLEGVAFKKAGDLTPVYYEAKQFMLDGKLPLPA
jgi:hypothetical protein